MAFLVFNVHVFPLSQCCQVLALNVGSLFEGYRLSLLTDHSLNSSRYKMHIRCKYSNVQ